MRGILLLTLFIGSLSFAEIQKFETACKNQDCFRNGWITTAPHYVLDTNCKNQDCKKLGWNSVANDHSTYEVTCRQGGCFQDGWASTQNLKGNVYYDDVLCRNSNCLTNGWTVRTGYDVLGGDVVCNNNDCSKFGGESFWRGRPSRTVCYEADCYHKGWTLLVY